MSRAPLIQVTSAGLFCARGEFYIDPWEPVPRAVITHAHADHARPGHGRYLTTTAGAQVLQARLGPEAAIDAVAYGAATKTNGVRLSLHPAGHVLGSAQVRVEADGEVWVISGDYKLEPDPTCTAFEPLPCHTFVTESTFGLPIYRWPAQAAVAAELNDWWRASRAAGRAAIVFAYAFGKSQRVLAALDDSIGPIYAHGAVQRVDAVVREAGVALPHTEYAGRADDKREWTGSLIIAPPSALSAPWIRKFGDAATAFVSGWMLIRGARRRRGVERGFVLSDHADWPGLLNAIRATAAERVLVTHGYIAPLVRWLNEQGIDAAPLATRFVGERDDADVDERADDAPNATEAAP